MDDEVTNLSPDQADYRPEYPRRRFTSLLVALVLLVVLIGIAERSGPRGAEGGGFSERALQGDLAVKISYAYEQLKPFLARNDTERRRIEAFQNSQRETAMSAFRGGGDEDLTVENARRLIILARPPDRAANVEMLAGVQHCRNNPCPEVRMWRDLYLSNRPLTRSEVDAYSSRIRSLDLGWYQHLALADLYDRGLSEKADRERREAARSAAETVIAAVALIFVMLMLGLAGIVLIVLYVNAKRFGRLVAREKDLDVSASERSFVAGYLLEAFVVYLLVTIGTQVAAIPFLLKSSGEGSGVEIGVYATTGVYVLAGVISAVYLRYRLGAAGWSWKTVGLGSENFGRDIAWGIGGYAAALPLVLVTGVVSKFVTRYIPTPSNPVVPLFAESRGALEKVVLILLVVVAAPFFEELFFRGVFYHSLRARWGAAMGIAAAAVLFGLVHPLPFNFLPIFALGSVFGILTYERASLLPGMIAHGLNNLAAFVLLSILVGS